MSRTWDGSGGDYLRPAGDPAALQVITGAAPYTVAAWIRPTAIGTERTVITKYTTFGPLLRLNATGKMGMFTVNAASQGKEAIGATTLVADSWYLVGGGWDPVTDVVGVFLNGVRDGVIASSTHHSTQANHWRIGERTNDTIPFRGQMGMVGIWSSYLSDAEWLALHAGASFETVAAASCVGAWEITGEISPEQDLTANNNDISVTGTLALSGETPPLQTGNPIPSTQSAFF